MRHGEALPSMARHCTLLSLAAGQGEGWGGIGFSAFGAVAAWRLTSLLQLSRVTRRALPSMARHYTPSLSRSEGEDWGGVLLAGNALPSMARHYAPSLSRSEGEGWGGVLLAGNALPSMARHYTPSLSRSEGEGWGGVLLAGNALPSMARHYTSDASRLAPLPQESTQGCSRVRRIANRSAIGKPASASAAITSHMPALHSCAGHALKPSLA